MAGQGRKWKNYILFMIAVVLCCVWVCYFTIGRGNEEAGKTGDGKETARKPLVFGATYMTMNNPYFQDMNARIEEMIEANGDILIYRDPAQNQQKQNEQILDMLEEGIDGLFLNPVNWETVEPALIACKEAGVPIFNVDTDVKNDEYVIFNIQSNNYNAGVQCAQDLMSKISSADIVILDSPGTNSINERVQGFRDTIAPYPNYQVVEQVQGMGELEVSMDVMSELIDAGTAFNVVLGGNDPSALGALAALQMNQKQTGVLIYGIDGSPDGKIMIKEGYMEGSSAQQPHVIADKAVRMAYAYMNGETVDKVVVVPVTMITRSNVDEFDLAGWQ